MRVGLVSPYSWTIPGGVNQHVEQLAEELEERGHEPWIIAPVGAVTPARRAVHSHRQTMAERFIPMGLAVPVPSNGSLAYLNFSPKILARMDRAVRYGRFDVLHVHEPATPLVSGLAVLMATSPVVGTFHAALDASLVYDAFRPVVATAMRRLDVRIAVSEAARAFPQSRFPGSFRIIPNGVPVEMFAPAVGAAKVRDLFKQANSRAWRGVILLAEALATTDSFGRLLYNFRGGRDEPTQFYAYYDSHVKLDLDFMLPGQIGVYVERRNHRVFKDVTGDLAQAVLAHAAHVHGRSKRHQRLIRADVRGRLFSADVLLACRQSEHKTALAIRVHRLPDDASRHLVHVLVLAREKAEVRAAEVQTTP